MKKKIIIKNLQHLILEDNLEIQSPHLKGKLLQLENHHKKRKKVIKMKLENLKFLEQIVEKQIIIKNRKILTNSKDMIQKMLVKKMIRKNIMRKKKMKKRKNLKIQKIRKMDLKQDLLNYWTGELKRIMINLIKMMKGCHQQICLIISLKIILYELRFFADQAESGKQKKRYLINFEID